MRKKIIQSFIFGILFFLVSIFIINAQNSQRYSETDTYFRFDLGITNFELQCYEIFQNQEFWAEATIETYEDHSAGDFNASIELPSNFFLPNDDQNHSNIPMNNSNDHIWITTWTVNSSDSGTGDHIINVTETLFLTTDNETMTINTGPTYPFHVTIETNKAIYSIGETVTINIYVTDNNSHPFNVDANCNASIFYPNDTATSYANNNADYMQGTSGHYVPATYITEAVAGDHSIQVNCSNYNQNYSNTTTFEVINQYPPAFENVSETGSYIHRDDATPEIGDVVTFTITINDQDNSNDELTVKFYYSYNETDWFDKDMTNTTPNTIWETTLTSASARTAYYYITASDGISTIRTPDTGYDNITWTELATTTTAGGGGGGGGGIRRIIEELIPSKDRFETDKDEIKIVFYIEYPEAIKTGFLKIINNLDEKITVDMNSENLENFLLFPSGTSKFSLALDEKETQTIQLNFFMPPDLKEGIFTGKITVSSGLTERTIPVIIEVQAEKPIFDIVVEVLDDYKELLQGEEVMAQITVFNLGMPGKLVDVHVNYGVKDLNENIIISRDETLAVSTQTSIIRNLALPGTMTVGTYVFFAQITYNGVIGTGTDSFNVVSEKGIKKFELLLIIITIFLIINIIVLTLLYKQKIDYGHYRTEYQKDIKAIKRRLKKNR